MAVSAAAGGCDGEVRCVRQQLRQELRGADGGKDVYLRQLRMRDSRAGAGVRALRLQDHGSWRGIRWPDVLLRQLRAARRYYRDGGSKRGGRGAVRQLRGVVASNQ